MNKSWKEILIEIGIGFVIGILLMLPIFVYQHMKLSEKPEEITTVVRDTTYISSIDTIFLPSETLSPIRRTIVDTVHISVSDTIFYRESLEYKDSIAEIYISGISPSLDSIRYFIPRDTVVLNTEIERTIVPKDSFWKNRFTLSAGVGAGYGLISKQPDIYVGATVGIRIF